MPAKFELGTYFTLRFTAGRSVIVGLVTVWAITGIWALALLRIPFLEALLGGLICAVGHVLMEVIHQLGHAWAARRTGYPMKGVHLWWLLGRSIYPSNEGDLPGSVHIRRALGGPLISALLSIALAVLALLFRPWDVTPGWMLAFLFLDNLLIFTVGALLPLGFTDGSTVLKWWGR